MDDTRKTGGLDFKQRLITRGGSDVKLYEVFEGNYINGAWYEKDRDVWYPCQWTWEGTYASRPSSLDLVNSTIRRRKLNGS